MLYIYRRIHNPSKMKKIPVVVALSLGLGFATAQSIQSVATKTTPVKANTTRLKKTEVKEVKSSGGKAVVTDTKTTTIKLKKDGTPDKRYKQSQHLKKDGTPDKRYKENK